MTDALGQVSVYYTAPAVTDTTPTVKITASFAGDAQYKASSENSQGVTAITISANILRSIGGTIRVNVAVGHYFTLDMLKVQPNAFSADNITFTVSQARSESVPGYEMTSPIFGIGPSGTTFSIQSTLTLPYDGSELPAGVSEGDLAIYCRTSGGGWERVGGTVNTTANTVSVYIDHLSEYAVMASTGGGLPLLMIGVVVVVILIVAVIAVFVIRRR
jgi:hypothetical protein